MNEQEAIKKIKDILEEATSYEDAVSYVTSCDEDALRLAIEALEKQIPKKTVVSKEYFACGHCPVCNDIVALHTRYCGECGNKIDWTV